jgi:hypothetical protein|tara:strand:+ start:396 stop:686 length:291 start_codon:yes stop_codon:yes gene_type:complete
MNHVVSTLNWIKKDYSSHPFRFVIEFLAWLITIGCSIVMAITVPNPPLFELYIVWIFGCILYTWAAFTRGSFGMLANYIALTLIDSFGLYRIITTA